MSIDKITGPKRGQLVRDIRLAHRLGFTVMRTKLGVIDDKLTPVENWREIIKMALPLAEECNVRMCPEIHIPTSLKSKTVDDYIEFIEQTGTKHFGINVDFGTFQTVFDPKGFQMPGLPEDGSPCSRPEDLVPLLPYIYCCHAKFNHMDENFEETTIPYKEILKVFMEHHWDGYLLSEYEGPNKDVPGFVSAQMLEQGDVQWPNSEVAVIKVKKEGGLIQGYHDVSIVYRSIMSYISPRVDLMPTKPFQKRMILV